MLTSIKNRFIGLIITKRKRDFNRVEIKYWREAGLECQSYIQCDYYTVFEIDGIMKRKRILRQSDYDKVVLKFNKFYPVLEWLKQEQS